MSGAKSLEVVASRTVTFFRPFLLLLGIAVMLPLLVCHSVSCTLNSSWIGALPLAQHSALLCVEVVQVTAFTHAGV